MTQTTVTTDPATAEPTTPDTDPSPNAEAAKYRRQLREAETARDALQARLDTLLTGEARRLAGETLADPDDLFGVGGVKLNDLLDEAGNIDPGRIATATADLIGSRPRLARTWQPPLTPDPSQGARQDPPATPTFTDAFRPRR